jgi:hypothetical protein
MSTFLYVLLSYVGAHLAIGRSLSRTHNTKNYSFVTINSESDQAKAEERKKETNKEGK